jgi:hypothetical protein
MRPRSILVTAFFAACGAHGPTVDHSHAADAIIASARTDEARAELTRARDEVDAAARERIRELDAEIARLEKENAALRQK